VEYAASGEASWMHGVCRDITERRHAQLEALRLQHEIAHVSRVSMMGQLASALAHELNQPLGAILRNAEAAELFMQTEKPDLEEIRVILVDIRTDDQQRHRPDADLSQAARPRRTGRQRRESRPFRCGDPSA
jgi:two-component system, LuxR family, sensor kinase FixL